MDAPSLRHSTELLRVCITRLEGTFLVNHVSMSTKEMLDLELTKTDSTLLIQENW